MSISNNPYVQEELENLQIQFGTKSLLTADDYCILFNTGKVQVSRHMKRRDIPHVKIGNALYVPMLDLAFYLAQKKAERDGRILAVKRPKDSAKNQRGFAKKAHKEQLLGK